MSVMIIVGFAGVSTQYNARVMRPRNRLRNTRRIARIHSNTLHSKRFQEGMDQSRRPAIKGHRINNAGERAGEREESRHDRGHARIEDQRIGGTRLQRHQLVFQYFGIWMRDPRVNQICPFIRFGGYVAMYDCKRPLRFLRGLKYVGGTAEYSRTRRTHRKPWIESARENCSIGTGVRLSLTSASGMLHPAFNLKRESG